MGNLQAASNRHLNLPATVIARGVEGVDCTHFVLFLPVSGSLEPRVQEAVDRALASVPEANALMNVAVYSDTAAFILHRQGCVRVRGDAVRIGSGPAGAQQ